MERLGHLLVGCCQKALPYVIGQRSILPPSSSRMCLSIAAPSEPWAHAALATITWDHAEQAVLVALDRRSEFILSLAMAAARGKCASSWVP